MTKRILIVEDDPIIGMDLESLAEEAGLAATWCASVREAMAHSERPDILLALLDIDVIDGKTFPVARRLAERDVPVLFLSGARTVDIPVALGTVPFMSKPYRAPDVLAVLRTALIACVEAAK